MKKILVVEDERIVADIYVNKFRHEGFQVELAENGEAALKTISRFRPDAMLLDLVIPGMDGLEVLKRLRAQSEFRNLPVVVFSNAYQSRLVEQAWKTGISACLIKASCTPRQVIETINKALQPVAPGAFQPGRGVKAKADGESHTEIVRVFSRQAGQLLAAMRALWQQFLSNRGSPGNTAPLLEMYRSAHSLTGNAAVAECLDLARLSGALEALLKELHEKQKYINPSTLRTVAHTIDFLGALVQRVEEPWPAPAAQPRILVVDDEILSRNTAVTALELADLVATTVQSPSEALKLLEAQPFDLLLLDVDMPGMTGFELCERLRALSGHRNTPVIFVTGLTDFESRARSTLSGGNDLIGKPFLLIELAIKALTYLLRGQLVAGNK